MLGRLADGGAERRGPVFIDLRRVPAALSSVPFCRRASTEHLHETRSSRGRCTIKSFAGEFAFVEPRRRRQKKEKQKNELDRRASSREEGKDALSSATVDASIKCDDSHLCRLSCIKAKSTKLETSWELLSALLNPVRMSVEQSEARMNGEGT